MPWWHRLAVVGAVLLLTVLFANLVDRRMRRRELAPEAATRYRVLRRSISVTIAFVGILSALLVIPQVGAVAGGLLASSAVLGIVIGFASQRTIGNFVAGILIAFTQPVRLGDVVEVEGTKGVVEEIGLTYTWLRTRENDRFVVPNEKLASDTIRNSTIRSPETLAEVTVQVPLSADLRAVVAACKRQEHSRDAAQPRRARLHPRAPQPEEEACGPHPPPSPRGRARRHRRHRGHDRLPHGRVRRRRDAHVELRPRHAAPAGGPLEHIHLRGR